MLRRTTSTAIATVTTTATTTATHKKPTSTKPPRPPPPSNHPTSPPAHPPRPPYTPANPVLYHGAVVLTAALALERSADVFLDAVAQVSTNLGVDETLVALLTAGAEWEELLVVVSALSLGQPSMALGNVVGSAIANLLGGIGDHPSPSGAPSLDPAAGPAALDRRHGWPSSDQQLTSEEGAYVFDASARLYSLINLVVTTLAVPLLWYVESSSSSSADRYFAWTTPTPLEHEPDGGGGAMAADRIDARRRRGVLLFGCVALGAAFVLYVLSAVWLMWRGELDVPEGSTDSDSGSDSDSDAAGAGGGRARGAGPPGNGATTATTTSASSSSSSSGPSPVRSEFTERSALLARTAFPPRHPLGAHRDAARRRRGASLARLVFTSTVLPLAKLLGALLLVSCSSYLVTSSLLGLADVWSLDHTTLGLTLVSVCTTLPEKVVGAVAATRGRTGVVVAATAGSNVFLLTLCAAVVLGGVALVEPPPSSSSSSSWASAWASRSDSSTPTSLRVTAWELATLWLATLGCHLVVSRARRSRRFEPRRYGVALLAVYLAFLALEVGFGGPRVGEGR